MTPGPIHARAVALTARCVAVVAAIGVLGLLGACSGTTDDSSTADSASTTPASDESPSTTETTQPTDEPIATTEPPCAALTPDDAPQAVVDAAGEGRTICLTAGRYERFSVVPQTGQHFVGLPGTVLDGLGETAHAFVTTESSKADDVIIEGIEMTGYASSERCESFRSDCEGAAVRGGVIFPHVALDTDAVPDVVIDDASSLRWTLVGNDIHDNLGTGVSTGHGMRVEDNRIRMNSHLGIGGGTVGDLVISGNVIEGNSHDDRVPANWESGQIKLGFIHDSTISNNTFTGVGPVIWCDIQCTDIDIVDNQISDIIGGRAVAIFYEVSESGTIQGNVIDNVRGSCAPADGVGVLLSESRDVVVTGNTITNAESLVLVQQIDRNRFASDISHWAATVTPDTDSLWTTRNLSITDNVLGPTSEGCSGAEGGRVGLLVEDVGSHPNTENVAPEVSFAGNDFAGAENSISFIWPTSPTPLDWSAWSALGQG